jgi:hypothetical protein
MTEDEARKKWCPHVRFSQWAEGIINNRGDLNGKHDCLASKCMAWRWCAEGYTPSGYCGLAGKP